MKNELVNTERLEDTFTEVDDEPYTGNLGGWLGILVAVVIVAAIGYGVFHFVGLL